MAIALILGSPTANSRSAELARFLTAGLVEDGLTVDRVVLRDLPPAALLAADRSAPPIAAAVSVVERAQGVIVATPIYKGAYAGLLKVFLDLLPHEALTGKVALPLATGGGPAHFLALDFALKPVLAALGARLVLAGVYATDGQIVRAETGAYQPDDATAIRLTQARDDLLHALTRAAGHPRAADSASGQSRRSLVDTLIP